MRLPLFPLGLVLFPGLVLPLHVFEDRYRQLVRELMALPDEAARYFGVIAIRQGRETGVDGVEALYDVGCTARLRHVEAHDGGGYDIVTVGAQRFRLLDIDASRPYLQGEVQLLSEEGGGADDNAAELELLVAAVRAAFTGYVAALNAQDGAVAVAAELPDEPVLLSYLVAAAVIVDVAAKQALLAQPDAAGRLRAAQALLRRETTLLRRLAAAPATELTRTPMSLN